ncbi:MAG: LD-carboxypeptidase [Bacilli bacterium]|nr:LD-carboxypeptidase [Bacilli bacterium]
MKIGIIAPANSIIGEKNINIFNEALKLLEKNGFEVIIGKNVFSDSECYCGTIDEKIEDIYEVALKAKYIICATGGINSNNILNKLDFNRIKENVFIGNSNPILLFNALYSINKQVSYIGPNIKTIGKNKSQFMIDCIKVITNGNNIILTEEPNIIINKGTGTGIAYGGNIQSLRRILGTKYFPKIDNSIIYLEADPTETNHTEYKSIINQLIQNNIFEKCNGLIIGKYDDIDFIKQIYKDFKMPIIICNNLGHNVNNNTLPIGKEIKINEDGSIEVL